MPVKFPAFDLPIAGDGAIRGLKRSAGPFQISDRPRPQQDVFKARLFRVVVDAAQSLIAPRFEIAGKDFLALAVHAAVLGVCVPPFPTGRGPLGDHITPARPVGARSNLVSDFRVPDVG